MRPKLSGRIVFIFSDPGGAKPCLSLIEENKLSCATAVSDRLYSFYKDFKTYVKILNHDFEQLVEDLHPELIFTGTSYTSDIEKQFIKIAHDKNIPCYSFVDHWTSISKRFEDASGAIFLPDKVWVIDERAKSLAINQGIDENKLVISGNPYHDWLKKWKPSINRNEFLESLALENQNIGILVYAPDPLSNINGMEEYGFDELSATSDLVDLFSMHQIELKYWKVLIKSHPNQDRDKLRKIISAHPSFILAPPNIDANTTIFFSDVVLGFFSSFLIEASIMNKPVLRFLDEKIKKDPIAELKIGEIVTKTSLCSHLININCSLKLK